MHISTIQGQLGMIKRFLQICNEEICPLSTLGIVFVRNGWRNVFFLGGNEV